MVIELCLLFIIFPIENCILMTRNALSIEAVGRRANNVLLNYYHIQYRPETMIVGPTEEQLDQREIPRQSLNSTAWVVGLARWIPPSALEQSSKKTVTARDLE